MLRTITLLFLSWTQFEPNWSPSQKYEKKWTWRVSGFCRPRKISNNFCRYVEQTFLLLSWKKEGMSTKMSNKRNFSCFGTFAEFEKFSWNCFQVNQKVALDSVVETRSFLSFGSDLVTEGLFETQSKMFFLFKSALYHHFSSYLKKRDTACAYRDYWTVIQPSDPHYLSTVGWAMSHLYLPFWSWTLFFNIPTLKNLKVWSYLNLRLI